MPKRVHSASEREDNGELKRTRKASDLVCKFLFLLFNLFILFYSE